MDEEIKMYLDDAKDNMEKAVQHSLKELNKIRAGRASADMLQGLFVEYYGAQTPIEQVAGITVADARSLMVKPWEKSMVIPIESAIRNSNLGLNPQNDGEMIRINIPPLSEERRVSFVKRAKAEIENAKISIRNARRDANEALKEMQKEGTSEDMIKRAETDVQKVTNEYIKKMDDILVKKEKDIMTV